MPRYSGVLEDITDRKQAERTLQLLVRELDHRVKNQFAVFDSLVQFTARAAPDTSAMARILRGRLQALASAHDLVRDATGDGPARGLRPTTLAALFEALLAPFGTFGNDDACGHASRVHLNGPSVEVGPSSASALALVVHELATNAVRHGALSVPEGTVEVSWSVTRNEGKVNIFWEETGGPQIPGEPKHRGFGTTLVRQSVKGQLGGGVMFDWSRAHGLSVTLEIPEDRLAC
jgi:two-component system CheB/CheR fusion protein